MRRNLIFTLTILQLVALPASSSTVVHNLASSCQEISSNPTWQVKDFTLSDILTGGSESSLSRVIDITFSLTNAVISSSTTCTAHDSLDKGQTWDSKVWRSCSRDPKNQVATQFEFDISNNNLSITQTWGCAFSPDGNIDTTIRANGSGIIPLRCKVHNTTHESVCEPSSASIRGTIVGFGNGRGRRLMV